MKKRLFSALLAMVMVFSIVSGLSTPVTFAKNTNNMDIEDITFSFNEDGSVNVESIRITPTIYAGHNQSGIAITGFFDNEKIGVFTDFGDPSAPNEYAYVDPSSPFALYSDTTAVGVGLAREPEIPYVRIEGQIDATKKVPQALTNIKVISNSTFNAETLLAWVAENTEGTKDEIYFDGDPEHTYSVKDVSSFPPLPIKFLVVTNEVGKFHPVIMEKYVGIDDLTTITEVKLSGGDELSPSAVAGKPRPNLPDSAQGSDGTSTIDVTVDSAAWEVSGNEGFPETAGTTSTATVKISPTWNGDRFDTDGIKVTDNYGQTWKAEVAPDGKSAILTYDVEIVAPVLNGYAVYDNGTLTFKYGCIDDETGEVFVVDDTNNSQPWQNYRQEIKKVVFEESFATARPKNTAYWFENCKNLTEIEGLEYLTTSEVMYMTSMFKNCVSLTNLDLSGFEVGRVWNMDYMFEQCTSLAWLDLSGWKVWKNTRMICMFSGCSRLKTIGVLKDADWSGVTAYCDSMFSGCKSLVGSNGTKCDNSVLGVTYARADGLDGKPGYFTVLTPIQGAYAVYDGNGTLTFKYHAETIRETGTVFSISQTIEQPWANYREDITKVVIDDTFRQFRPQYTAEWFKDCINLTSFENLNSLDVSEVVDMSSMFASCEKLENLDISSWNTHSVTDMSSMFAGCAELTMIDAGMNGDWRGNSTINSADMFKDCVNLTGAVAYYPSKTDISMANNTTGYFNPIPASTPEFESVDDTVMTQYGDRSVIPLKVKEISGHTLSYQWYVLDNSLEEWVVIDGANSSSYEIPAETEIGIHQYRCEVTATRHDNGQSKSVQSTPISVHVTPLDPNVMVLLKSWTYGEEANEPIVEGNVAGGEVEYRYQRADDGEYLDEKPSEAGKYIVTAEIAPNGGYSGAVARVEFEIYKAKPAEIVFPTASELVYGALLSESVLSGGSENGTFAWTDASIIPNVKNTGYDVTFTPNDSDNYDYSDINLTQKVDISVSKADQPTPNAPLMGEVSPTRIAIKTVQGGVNGVEYAINTINKAPREGWSKDKLIYYGLTPSTSYFFFARYIGDDNYNASPASVGGRITTLSIAAWPVDKHIIKGTTIDKNDNPVGNIAMELYPISVKTVSNENGEFEFEDIPEGSYNLILKYTGSTGNEQTTTIHFPVTGSMDGYNILVPDLNVNSVVEIEDGAPEIRVNGLDKLAENVAGNDNTSDDVTITMKVAPVEKDDDDEIQQEINKVAKDSSNIDYIDIKLTKTVNDVETDISDTAQSTNEKIQIIIPCNLNDKKNIALYRYDGATTDETKAITVSTDKSQDEYYEVSDEGYIVVYTNQFTTYAIGYEDDIYEPKPTATPSGNISNGGNSSGGGSSNKPQATAQPTSSPAASEDVQQANGGESSDWWFIDVPENLWFYAPIKYAYDKGLMVGVTHDEFMPDTSITRAMFITVLYRIEGEPDTETEYTFTDIKKDWYYEKPVAWGSANGIVAGYSDEVYAPDDKITREQMAAILLRYAKYKGMDISEDDISAFPDADDTSEYAIPALKWAYAADIVNGYDDGTLRPLANSTRAQTAAMLRQFNEILKN